mgnify:CR=1 FL=1
MMYVNCLNELLKTISHPVFVIDENNKVIFHNSLETLTCNWDGEKPIEKTIFNLFTFEEANLLHNACKTVIESKKVVVHPICFIKNGGQVYAKAKILPFFNPDTNDWYKICIIDEKTKIGIQNLEVESSPTTSYQSRKTNLFDTDNAMEEAKRALHFLLKEGAEQMIKLREETLKNMANQFLPLIDGLKNTKLNETQLHYAKMLEASIRNLTEPFTRNVSDPMFRLSPMELKIASMVRAGKSNKEMAEIFHLSKSTILTHRHHVRDKLGLKNKKQNLRSFLSSFGSQLKNKEPGNLDIDRWGIKKMETAEP